MLLFCLVVMATLGRQGCRSSLGSSLGVPAPLRGAVLLSVETWTRRESGEGGGTHGQNWPLSGGRGCSWSQIYFLLSQNQIHSKTKGISQAFPPIGQNTPLLPDVSQSSHGGRSFSAYPQSATSASTSGCCTRNCCRARAAPGPNDLDSRLTLAQSLSRAFASSADGDNNGVSPLKWLGGVNA